jgi:hypothetical protein
MTVPSFAPVVPCCSAFNVEPVGCQALWNNAEQHYYCHPFEQPISHRGANMTRDHLATLAGLSRARIEALENKRVPEMGCSAVLRLLRVLSLDLAVITFNRG